MTGESLLSWRRRAARCVRAVRAVRRAGGHALGRYGRPINQRQDPVRLVLGQHVPRRHRDRDRDRVCHRDPSPTSTTLLRDVREPTSTAKARGLNVTFDGADYVERVCEPPRTPHRDRTVRNVCARAADEALFWSIPSRSRAVRPEGTGPRGRAAAHRRVRLALTLEQDVSANAAQVTDSLHTK